MANSKPDDGNPPAGTEIKPVEAEQQLRHLIKPAIGEAEMRDSHYTDWRTLPDGTVLSVGPMLHGNGRLYIDVHHYGYEDCYCYDTLEGATQAMHAFDPETDKEPTGWKRHPHSGRRRPGGDETKEFVTR